MVINPRSVQPIPTSLHPAFENVPLQQARPFVKWVGGKTQLISQLDANFPEALKSGKVTTYIEPFVGGGAIFFHIAQNYHVKRCILADTNADLILAYWTIRERVGQLITTLYSLQGDYTKLSERRREEYYYEVRTEFNAGKNEIDLTKFSTDWITRTAQLIFLNKTCFNGLFRVNSAGLFNVSFGKYENPKICDPENLIQAAQVLRGAEILLCDFQDVLDVVDSASFAYIDPPYRPLTDTANFTSYSANTFTALDQQRLAKFCCQVNQRGAKVLISNSDPSNIDPRDSFFEQTYPGFRISQTEANRMINCRADRRGKIRELLITNY